MKDSVTQQVNMRVVRWSAHRIYVQHQNLDWLPVLVNSLALLATNISVL